MTLTVNSDCTSIDVVSTLVDSFVADSSNCSDASFAGRLYLSGTWESNANSAIINTSGSGIVLTDFIGRGGSTASPITTSGAGDVAILSAAFNNITAITGTTSGATPLQDAGF